MNAAVDLMVGAGGCRYTALPMAGSLEGDLNSAMYGSARAAITNTTGWGAGTTEIYFLLVLEARSQRSRCQQGWFLLRSTREGCVAALSPWLVMASSPYVPTLSFSVCFCDHSSPFSEDSSHWIRAHIG